jgi:hypothetical protein
MMLGLLIPVGFSFTRWIFSFFGGVTNFILGMLLVPGTLLAVHFQENPNDIPEPVQKAIAAYHAMQDVEENS